jgi:3-(3-hydroxy-phenyl)propionate hydroxylase
VNTAVADVAVVGYGPVGATLANLLGRLGHRVDVFESTTSVYHLPRAAHFDGEAMRIFQAAGLADAIAPVTAPIAGMYFVNTEGKKLFGYDAPQGRGENGWANNYMFYQPDLERVLRAGADRFPNVHVHLGHEVVSITQDDERVEVGVRDLHDDTTQRVEARYLVGCDGARSVTRSAAGITLEDLRFDQPWLVVDTVLTRPVDLPPMSVQYCDPARPVTYVPMGSDRRRWEFMLLPGESAESMEDPDRVRALLAPWVAPEDLEIVRAVVYTFHAVMASPWRNGRLFVMGDAAHQMPPFLGQGMCAGIRDAQNLSWKVDLVLTGAASQDLLDTYEAERSPHVRTIIETAVNAGHIIQTTDPVIASTRDAHFLANPRQPGGPGAVRMPGLAGGVLASGTAWAGELLAQPEVDGTLLDDHCGLRFAIIGRQDARRIMAEPAVAFWDSLPGAFVADDGLTAWLDNVGAEYVVLRPDRYVYGVATDTGELDALAERLRTQLGSRGSTGGS